MSFPTCTHPIPEALRLKLIDVCNKCPTCIVRSHIAEVKDIQNVLSESGGVKKSRANKLVRTKGMNHKEWTDKWRQAKAQFQRELDLLEDFKEQDHLAAEGCGIYHALQVWESEFEVCAVLPGWNDPVENAVVPAKKTNVNADSELEETELSEKEKQDFFPKNRSWSVKPMRKPRRRRVAIEAKPLREEIQASSTSSSSDDTTCPDEQALKEMEAVTNRLDQGLKMGSWNLFEAVAEVELGSMAEPETSTTPSPPPSPVLSKTDPHNTPSLPFPSAFKGSRPPPPDQKPSVSFDEMATIFSEHEPPTSAPHNQTTLAELARSNHSFYRFGAMYSPATWASPAGSEKANNSFKLMSWDVRERMIERNDGEEDDSRKNDEETAGLKFTYTEEDDWVDAQIEEEEPIAATDGVEPEGTKLKIDRPVPEEDAPKINAHQIQLAFRPAPVGSLSKHEAESDTSWEMVERPTVEIDAESTPVPPWLELSTINGVAKNTAPRRTGGASYRNTYGVGERESER